MRMRGNGNIHAIFQQELYPLLCFSAGIVSIFHAAVQEKDNAVADFLSLGNIGGNLFLIQEIDKIGLILRQDKAVHTISIIKHSKGDAITFHGFNGICIGLILVDTQHCNVRVVGFPEIQRILNALHAAVIHVVCGMGHYIKTSIHQSIANFHRPGKAWIAGIIASVICKDRFLVHDGQICGLNIGFDIGIKVVKIVGAVGLVAGLVKAGMDQIVAHCQQLHQFHILSPG